MTIKPLSFKGDKDITSTHFPAVSDHCSKVRSPPDLSDQFAANRLPETVKPPGGQCFPDFQGVIEKMFTRLAKLITLMPFAGNKHDILNCGRPDGRGNSGGPAMQDQKALVLSCRSGEPGQ